VRQRLVALIDRIITMLHPNLQITRGGSLLFPDISMTPSKRTPLHSLQSLMISSSYPQTLLHTCSNPYHVSPHTRTRRLEPTAALDSIIHYLTPSPDPDTNMELVQPFVAAASEGSLVRRARACESMKGGFSEGCGGERRVRGRWRSAD
jgi:hypothetical protein